MTHIFGIFLLVSGGLSLLFNERAVLIRRIWPWRRDDADPKRDERLNERYRLLTYLGAIAAIETGVALVDITTPSLWRRALVYCVFGAWLVYRRPAMRTLEFWRALPSREGRSTD